MLMCIFVIYICMSNIRCILTVYKPNYSFISLIVCSWAQSCLIYQFYFIMSSTFVSCMKNSLPTLEFLLRFMMQLRTNFYRIRNITKMMFVIFIWISINSVQFDQVTTKMISHLHRLKGFWLISLSLQSKNSKKKTQWEQFRTF
jgi:hypothetical protein